jgi:phosphoglycerate dehydrogenase-like enzyme
MRIAVLDDYAGAALEVADWSPVSGFDIVVFDDHVADLDAVAQRLRTFEVVVAMRERTAFPRRLLEKLPALQLLVTTGMVNAAIDLDACRDHNIVVCGTGGIASGTAELTWGLILAQLRHIVEEDCRMREGGWQRTLGGDLHGQTLGILGLGRVGSQVARVGLAFGMDVIAWSENLTADAAAAVGITRVDRKDLFKRSDVLTIHVVLSDRTAGIVTYADLCEMRPSAVVVNTARGPIIAPGALARALDEGRIAGAAVDVYDREPLPHDDPMRQQRNTVLTPHLGYVTRGGYSVFYREVVEDIVAWFAGAPVRRLV